MNSRIVAFVVLSMSVLLGILFYFLDIFDGSKLEVVVAASTIATGVTGIILDLPSKKQASSEYCR